MKKLLFTLAITLLVFGVSKAQDNNDQNTASHQVEITIPLVALVDVEGPAGEAVKIDLDATFTGEAGEGLDFSAATNNELWLNYTSIVASSGATRKISVAIDANALPTGVSLNLSAATSTTGRGTLGAGQTVALSTTSEDLVTGIESGYTGDGSGKGCNLTYSLDMADLDDYATLTESNSTVTVTYTIADN